MSIVIPARPGRLHEVFKGIENRRFEGRGQLEDWSWKKWVAGGSSSLLSSGSTAEVYQRRQTSSPTTILKEMRYV